MKKKPTRVCAICGKGGSTMGFKTALYWLGLPNWRDDKAHPTCVRKLREAQNKSTYTYTDPSQLGF